MSSKPYLLLILFVALIWSCKKPYNPPAINAPNSYLVVEGVINTGTDSTVITLSRTVKLDSNTTLKSELHAQISVQSDNNVSYPLTEIGSGKYASSLNLDRTKKYRLHIVTTDGTEYASDYAASVNTPDIDSIPYKVTSTGIQFYVNTHDPTNNTRYYRWSFDETWSYVSSYYSVYEIMNGKITYRPVSDLINTCYKTKPSQQVLIGSSAKLAQDVIAMQPVNFVLANSGKISFGYSFLLKQYGLTKEAYQYWDNLKKNTESLGSIFDAQPSTITGNIHCVTHPETPVLGYISVSLIRSHRIFIDHNNIALYTPNYIPPPDSSACKSKGILFAPLNSYDQRFNNVFANGDFIPVTDLGLNGVLLGYVYAPKECVDCRLKSPFGTTAKPLFWK